MAEDPLVNKSQPPPEVSDAEYDAIYATVSETAQGRRFLEEYARRCRPAEPEASLAAIERMRAAVDQDTGDRLDLLLEMAEMAQAIARMRAEIQAIAPPPGATALEATEELDAIVSTTESATSRILTAAEQVQEIAWTMRESGSIDALCDELDARATEIYTACSFQDLTGQRTRKVIQVLRYLEDRINATVAARDKEPAGELSAGGSLAQADVDAVMQPRPDEDERQDATLEDISRLMLAIEPMIGLQQASTDEPAEQVDANIVQATEDVRPELSVAEAVMAEAEAARAMTEWAVEMPMVPPAARVEAALPLAEWIVEDPQAPRPEAEPAWLILQRLETELDEEAEAGAQSPAFVPAPPIPPAPAVSETAPLPPSPAAAEPALFVAEAMSQLAQTLRPVALMPPPELVFRASLPPIQPPADPMAELQSVMAAVEMTLLQPGEDVEAAPEPAAESELMKRAAAIATGTGAPAASMRDAPPPPAELDVDDFLFAQELQETDQASTAAEPQDAPQKPVPPEATATLPDPAPAVEWEGGTFPDPALVTPQTGQAPEAEPQPAERTSYDPLAPLRALSDEQKIALFS